MYVCMYKNVSHITYITYHIFSWRVCGVSVHVHVVVPVSQHPDQRIHTNRQALCVVSVNQLCILLKNYKLRLNANIL